MFTTKRLKLEPLQNEHIAALEKLFCENHLVMQSTLKGRVFTTSEFETFIHNEFITNNTEKFGFRCVIAKTNNQFIGVSGLHPFQFQDQNTHEFGFILHQDYWGKGLATEIGNFWINYAKNELGLTTVMATVNQTNMPSKRVLEKLGMKAFQEINTEDRGPRLLLVKQL